MGRGDKRSRRGKIRLGSSGKSRPKPKKTGNKKATTQPAANA